MGVVEIRDKTLVVKSRLLVLVLVDSPDKPTLPVMFISHDRLARCNSFARLICAGV